MDRFRWEKITDKENRVSSKKKTSQVKFRSSAHGNGSDSSPERPAPPVQSHSSGKKKKHKRTASLTDLRPEDKRKVANLIQEIAHLGSEKDAVEEKLRKERTDFENAIRQLVTDQKQLLSERHSVQSELTSCQQMLQQLQEVVINRSQSGSFNTPRDQNQSLSGSKPSELEEYITRSRNETLDTNRSRTETMETQSDIASVYSERINNPRTSSTVLDTVSANRGQPEVSLNYSRKEDLQREREKLVEEQRLLRRKLMEQEELLRHTQKRLQEQEEHQRSLRIMNAAYVTELNRSQHKTQSPNTSYRNNNEQKMNRAYSVGVQVNTPLHDSNRIRPANSPREQRIQTDLPQSYIGKRLIPSPNYQYSTIDNTMQRTSQLLNSARKIINDANNYQPAVNQHQHIQSHASYSLATPRKTHRELFNSHENTLVSDLNDDMNEVTEADRTENELLKDVFYVL